MALVTRNLIRTRLCRHLRPMTSRLLRFLGPQNDRHRRCKQLRWVKVDCHCLIRRNLMCPLQDLPPHSLIEAHAAMNAKYPDDRFDIWPRLAPSGEQEWRGGSLECPGE